MTSLCIVSSYGTSCVRAFAVSALANDVSTVLVCLPWLAVTLPGFAREHNHLFAEPDYQCQGCELGTTE